MALLKPEPYSVFNFYHKDGVWQKIAKHPLFENITLTVITANAVYMAIDTDWNKAPSLTEASTLFQFMEHAFCTYFFGEWLIRFLAFKNKLNGRKDAWFVFDSVLVFMMVMETWVLLIVQAISGSSG